MTLQQAHEIQRKELISLRAKVVRLEKQSSGLFPNEEKEALERHIRHLEHVNKTESKRLSSARAHFKIINKRCNNLEIKILELEDQIAVLKSNNASLLSRAEIAENEVQMLNGTNKKLEKKLNTNFENSSLPSSALPFRKKIPNNRKPSGKKPGAHG